MQVFDDQEFRRQYKQALTQFKKTFGGEPETLAQAVRRAGRLLPPKGRRAARVVMAAEKQAGHPKLSRQLDGVKITMAFDMLGEALARVDMKDRRKGLILGVLGSMAFNLIALIALFVLFALWRGWV